jgi:hypothetical protein
VKRTNAVFLIILITFLILIAVRPNDSFGGNSCSIEAGSGRERATWTPDLWFDGNYRVYVWFEADPEAATDAPFTVNYNGGSQTVMVNQQTGGGHWYQIGPIFNFFAGISGSVVLSNNADGKVIADAVKFVNIDYPEQEIIVDNSDATFVGAWNWQCSPSGADVETCLPDTGVCVTFPYVAPPGGDTTIETASPGPDKPGYKFIGASCDGSLYYNISTTASYTASEVDPVKVCITYDDSCLPPGKENSNSLKIFHCKNGCQNGNGWQDATCSLDTVKNEICACVTSLSSFAIGYEVSADVVTLILPNGGDVIPSGGIYGICWEAPLEAVKFDLYYSLTNGTSWNFIKTIAGLYCTHWEEVPVVTANKKNCRVKVIGYDSNGAKVGEDISDKPFTIEVLRVTSPNGGETLKSGDTVTIQWTTHKTVIPVAKTVLKYTNNGTTWEKIKTLTGDPGSYSWTVPNVSSTKCKLKVILKDSNGVNVGTDVSDKVFTIQP